MNRNDVTEMIIEAKVKKGIKWDDVAKKVGLSKEWVTAGCLGQMTFDAKQAKIVAKTFGLPAEAEKWLSIAAGRGHKEAKKLLAQASTAKKNEVAYRRWVDTQRVYLREYWQSRYTYRWYWNNSGWYYRDDY